MRLRCSYSAVKTNIYLSYKTIRKAHHIINQYPEICNRPWKKKVHSLLNAIGNLSDKDNGETNEAVSRNLSTFRQREPLPNWVKHTNITAQNLLNEEKIPLQIQKEARMDRLKEDWNGLQLWFLKTCKPNRFSKFIVVWYVWNHAIQTYCTYSIWQEAVILSFTGNFSSSIAHKYA